jgi:hypothetical protein
VGNFSSVANSIDGVRYGSIAVAEFTGDGREDIVVSGQLVNGSGSLSLYANNGSMSFVRRSDAGFLSFKRVVQCRRSSAPLSQATALDLVLFLLFFLSLKCFCVHQQWFWIFYTTCCVVAADSIQGAVVRGPDIGASPSFLAMGRTNSSSYDGSTLVGYLDSGTLISYASNLFENAKRAISLSMVW